MNILADNLTEQQQALINAWSEKVNAPIKPKDEKIPNLIPPPGNKKAKPIESILFMIRDEIEATKSLTAAQHVIETFIKTYQLKTPRSMSEYRALMSIKESPTYEKLLSHMYASILTYSGLGSPDAQRNRNKYR